MIWYYVEGDEQKGPVDEHAFRRLIEENVVREDTLVWREGLPEWDQWGNLAEQHAAPPGDEDAGLCAECGRAFAADQLITYGEHRICEACKPAFFQKVREGVPVFGAFRYAGFWIRGVALFLDAVILMFANMLITMMVQPIAPQPGAEPTLAFVVMGVTFVLNMAIGCAYSTWFVGRFGATPGKMACGLRVVMPDGGSVTFMRAFARYFAEIVSGVILYIGYLMAAFDEEKRSLHDRMCHTRVVYK